MLRLWVCGRIAGEFDGEPVPIPTGDRARALIGWLALRPGPNPREALAERLWPEAAEGSARASLRTVVWSIRQTWGPVADAVLEVSRGSIGFRPGVWIDALEASPAPEGELLPGVDDDWVRGERAEHRDRQARILERLALAAEREGRGDDAVRWSRRRCAVAPLDEGAHRDLLRRLEEAGDHTGAVLAAREFSNLLRAELGVRPSPATRAAQSRLQPSPASPASPAGRAGPAPALFGRAGQVAELGRAWRAAAAGKGQVVVLTGEAGIGKTSLLADLAHRVGNAGGRSAIAAGIDVGGETPFGVWLELARALVATAAPVPAGVAWPVELSRLSPDLGAGLGRPAPPPAVAAPEIERLRVFESVLRLVEWSCTDRPVLIGLDDAHSADRASLRLTAHIGRRLGALPLMLVLARRDRPSRPELEALLADLGGRSLPVTEVAVGPISDRDVGALASALLRLDDDALRRVVSAAEGNPLLAVESTRALAAGGGSPPPNLRTAVRATLGRLPPDSQGLARLLSAAGRPLSGAEIDGLGLRPDPDRAGTVEAGIESGLLTRSEGRIGFRHALLREVVYADLADPASSHARVAAALAEGTDRAEVARHLTLAGRPGGAAREWAAAAAYARSVGALTEAAQFLDRATECAPGDGWFWLELAEVCAWLGRTERMDEAWNRGLAVLAPADLPAAWCGRGRQLRSVICHPEASFAAYRQAEVLLTPHSTAKDRADVLVGLSWSHAVAGDAARVEPLLAQAATLLPPEPDPHVVTDIAEIRIQALIRQGRFTECAEIAWTTAAAQSDLPDRAYAVWINAACALACAGDHEGALALADRAVETTTPVPVLLVPCLAARAHLLARLGRVEEATATVRRLRECAARLDSPALNARSTHDAGLVAFELGRYGEAAELLGAALAAGAPVSRPSAGLCRAEALARSGAADAADAAAAQLRAAVLEPVARADQPWALVPRMTGIQGLIAAARGDRALAARRFEEAAAGWRRMLGSAAQVTADGYLANLVDLGRPPVVGLVEPVRELERLEHDRAALTAGSGR